MIVYSYPVEGSVSSLEGHVVCNQAQVSLVHLDAVHVEHASNLLDDGLTRRLDPVVLSHVMNVVTGKLLYVENLIEVEIFKYPKVGVTVGYMSSISWRPAAIKRK